MGWLLPFFVGAHPAKLAGLGAELSAVPSSLGSRVFRIETVTNEKYAELQADNGPRTEKAEAASPVSRWEYLSERLWHPFNSEGSNTNIEQVYQRLLSGDSDGMVKVISDVGTFVRVDVRLMLVRTLYQSKKCKKQRRLRGSSSDSF